MYSRDYQRERLEACAHFGHSCYSNFMSNKTAVHESADVVEGTTMLQKMTKNVPGECRRSLVAPTCVPTNGYVKRFLSFAKLVRVITYVHCF